ncbi:hypothetical protein [Arenimonas daejeonensis]|uniref:hypothetical protein n=1 Tax=Arenimonas daejeonensis TaxID=370777 RepID=UPI0011BE033A|nr:hypothetical protein [Arenimonas daejeonensis]
MIRDNLTAAALAIGLAAAAFPMQSNAADYRYRYVGATNACDATDPANFTGLRFRTIGVFNASLSSIQIACSVPADLNADNGSSQVSLFLTNFKNTPVTVNCTVSAGSRSEGTNNYPQGGQVPADTTVERYYGSIDRVSTAYTHYNVTCILPPGVELSTIRVVEYSAELDL